MKITIQGPEGDIAEITKKGDYTLRRIPELGPAERLCSLSAVEGVNEEPKPIAREHMSISRKHLGIVVGVDGIVLVDQGSKLGSFLNEEKFKRTEIKESGEYALKLGNVCFKLNYEK